MKHPAFARELSRDELLDWYRRGRERTRALFDLIVPEAYYDRPIALRNPTVFYEGHLPAFNVNTLVKLTLGKRGVDEPYETLFARGIDPDSEDAVKSPTDVWPSRAEVQAYGRAADALIEANITEGNEATFTILEHEVMHQETLLYMFHNLPYEKKRAQGSGLGAQGIQAERSWAPSPEPRALIPAGIATLGAPRTDFGWDNEFDLHTVDVPAFSIDVHNVTNADYLAYIEATGANPPHFWARIDGRWQWRGMFAPIPLPPDWPVYVTQEEAVAYARWKNRRLPTEAEYHRAAFGSDDRMYPGGDEPPDATRGQFDFVSLDPAPVGSHPAGGSAWGVHDLVGNGWEWTSTPFAPFAGFKPMPSYPLYSTDFFDDAHYVLKGASPVTGRELIRRSFRNWFRPNYPYLYATFRTVG